MASTVYCRPDLFPFSFASIPDLTLPPPEGEQPYVIVGNVADAIQLVTQIASFQYSVSFSYSYLINPSIIETRSLSASYGLPGFSPITAGFTGACIASWFNTDTVGNSYPTPASRVLRAPSNDGGLIVFSGINSATFGTPYAGFEIQLSRTESNIAIGIKIAAALYEGSSQVRSATLPSGYTLVATSSVNFLGYTIPTYLYDADGVTVVGVSTFSTVLTTTLIS
jgi:hypothetical protein